LRKSAKIATTPTQGSSAVVTPSTKMREREQANAKKIKQGKKKGLEDFFGQGPQVSAPSREGTLINAVVQQRENRSNDGKGGDKPHLTRLVSLNGLTTAYAMKKLQAEGGGERGKDEQTMGKKDTKKMTCKSLDDKNSRRSKRTKSDDKVLAIEGDQPDGVKVNLEAMKGSLRKKGTGMAKSKGLEKKDKKTATFAEAAGKGTARRPEAEIKYNKCIVAFTIIVDNVKDTKAAFDKKIIAALSFLQNYINEHAAFFSIDALDSSRPPIKEKADVPAFQVILRKYFDIPNKRAFDSMTQDKGRAIKGSAIMGFSLDPRKCSDEAAGNLRHMGCAIFYKQCKEVSTIVWQILLGAPNTIEADIIKQTMDKELKLVEQKLLLDDNAEYRPSKRRQSKWLSYAVVQEFPARMPWEGAEEKKQKQGTNNARLVYVLHVHKPDYGRMKTLLAYAKDWKVWHRH
jgi:hypothetical protein